MSTVDSLIERRHIHWHSEPERHQGAEKTRTKRTQSSIMINIYCK